MSADGVYRVLHVSSRIHHEITLLAGGIFPRCIRCGFAVTFELLRAVPHAIAEDDFRIHLYEIPHPEDEAAGALRATGTA